MIQANLANQSTHLVKLDHTRLLLVNGPDASKFLQGQVTCDIRELSDPVTLLGAQCNPKGRILLSFRALQMAAETIALRVPAAMVEKAKTSLGKYIVFSKSTVQDAGHYTLFGIYGADADRAANTFFKQVPLTQNGWIENDGNFLLRLADEQYECWIKTDDAGAFEQALADFVVDSDVNGWDLLTVRAGVADIHPETIELFTPQEINYQLVNGINFRKGCYTGQEIVARLHYRGKLKRHMYRFQCTGDQLPARGTALVNALTRQHCGHLVTAARAGAGKIELLASLLDEQLDQVTLDHSTEILKQLPLPYAIPTADNITD